MYPLWHSPPIPRPQTVVRLAVLVVLAICALTLTGWVFDLTLLKSIEPQWNSMKVVTVICLAAVAAALAGLKGPSAAGMTPTAPRVLGIAVSVVGLVTLSVYLAEHATGREISLISSPVLNLFLAHDDRMAALTALIFVILGLVLVLLGTGSRHAANAAHALLLPATFLSYVILLEYLLGIEGLHEWLDVSVALHTGVAFWVVCIGLFGARDDTWLMTVFFSDLAGGHMVRRLLPALVILPLVIGWLRLNGERAGIFSSEVGVGLVAATNTVCLLWLVWLTARSVDVTDDRRRQTEKAQLDREKQYRNLVEKAKDELEQRVQERTEQLEAASAYARSLIEASLDPLVTISPTGKITDVNEATEEATGITRDQLLGSDFSDIFAQPDMARRGYQQVLAEGFVRDYPLTIRHTSGRTIEVLYNATVYRDEAGEVKGVFAAARDITERKRVEEELDEHRKNLERLVRQRTFELEQTAADLARSNRDLEQFAYVSSHDLQEPLRMVTGFMRLFDRAYRGKLDPTADQYIHFAVDGAKRMQALIDGLLAYSRLGTRSKKPESTDFSQAFRFAVSNLTLSIQESGARITAGDLPTVRADESQLIQLFQNLIGNALKFRSDQPLRIHVDARREGDNWVFSVKDNGIGIDPEFHQKIFMIFQRLHTRDKHPGDGMGLAICKKIVERHGGTIWVESVPAQGATFCFTLPV